MTDKMYSAVQSAAVVGIAAFKIEIETHAENNLPGFTMVGLPDSAVKESKERVFAAIKNSSIPIPPRRFTVNLAPADIRKEGSGYDLPIAIGILCAVDILIPASCEDALIIGELALDGSVRPIHGALSIALEAPKWGIKRILLPEKNASEAGLIQSGVEVIPIKTLEQAVRYLRGEIEIEPLKEDISKFFEQHEIDRIIDMTDVKGQDHVKRALEVAAAGGHNVILVGPPGSGKSMLAKRFATILPPMTFEEALETTKIHSAAGILSPNTPIVTQRPFRSPHHTISDAALVGGGVGVVRAGEISMANHGVLFLDELPEFARNVLEVLRQPLEDKHITISRTKMSVQYPANFLLFCALNPCPCGNYGSKTPCTCSETAIKKYISKISGPLLDRIDIHIEVPAVQYKELSSTKKGETSETIRTRVINARNIQQQRFSGKPHLHKNADMGSKDLLEYCQLDVTSQELLNLAMQRIGLSARAYDRIRKVARTIADLANSESITAQHISEAINYRALDRGYWNV